MNIINKISLKRLLILLLVPLILIGAVGLADIGQSQAPESQFASLTEANTEEISFKNVKKYSSNGEAKGTVIYIPQIHRAPGSDFNDKSNDPGFKTQKEIYSYLNTLYEKHGITFVMGESGMYGELPENYVIPVKEAISDKTEFTKNYKEFTETLDPQYNDYLPMMDRKVDKGISDVDRNIYLRGAGIKLEAKKGDEVLTYGSQNPKTYAKTVQLVQEKMAISKKMQSLNGATDLTETIDTNLLKKLLANRNETSSPKSRLLKKLLSKSNSNQVIDLSNAFSLIERKASASGDGETLEDVNSLQKQAEDLDQFMQQPLSSVKIKAKVEPVRNLPDNPVQLKKLAKQNDAEFKEIVIEKRSHEAVDNFIAGMKESGHETGVLIYGAGHGEQIIDRFNDKGYNVIAVIPDLVKERYPQI